MISLSRIVFSRAVLLRMALVSGLAALLFQSASVAQEAKKAVQVSIKGQIDDNDEKDPVQNQPCKTHVVMLEKGKTYVIDMKSTDFDAYLRIESSAGREVAKDDDSGGNRNARIRFTPTKDDSYKIIATSFSGGQGNYSLTVNDTAAGAGAGGGGVSQGLAKPAPGKPASVKAELKEGDAPDPMLNHPSKKYDIELEKGVAYSITLRSDDFDSFLRLLDANGKELAHDDDSGGKLDAQIVFTPTTTAKYQIVATSLNDNIGGYALSVDVFGKGFKYNPQAVLESKEPFCINAELKNNDPKDAVQQQSPCHVHQVKLEKGKTYVIDLMSGRMDCFLRIEDNQKANLADDDDGGEGLNSRLSFTPDESGVFRIIATNLNGGGGPYILTVREQK